MADNTPIISIVGAESLLGRELVDVLAHQNLPAHVTHVADLEPAESSKGVLTQEKGEPLFIAAPRANDLTGSRVVILAGNAPSAVKVAETAQRGPNAPAIIDLTGTLEENPAARLRAPMVEAARPSESAPIYVIAHPAAIALALVLKQLAKAGTIRRVLTHVFEPVSERGKRGLDELQQQTVALLSFQKFKTDVFDTQVSFNMLPEYGSEAVKSLDVIEHAIERHLATLLMWSDPRVPMPSLRVVHAPVFHGYSFSLWVEFETRPAKEVVAAVLATNRIEVRAKDEEAPSNVGIAGQSGITVGSIVPDRNEARACWFWMVADNLRISADNGVEVARELLG